MTYTLAYRLDRTCSKHYTFFYISHLLTNKCYTSNDTDYLMTSFTCPGMSKALCRCLHFIPFKKECNTPHDTGIVHLCLSFHKRMLHQTLPTSSTRFPFTGNPSVSCNSCFNSRGYQYLKRYQ